MATMPYMCPAVEPLNRAQRFKVSNECTQITRQRRARRHCPSATASPEGREQKTVARTRVLSAYVSPVRCRTAMATVKRQTAGAKKAKKGTA